MYDMLYDVVCEAVLSSYMSAGCSLAERLCMVKFLTITALLYYYYERLHFYYIEKTFHFQPRDATRAGIKIQNCLVKIE